MDLSFRTEFTLTNTNELLKHQAGAQLIGSCFSVNLAKKLSQAGFQVQSNPFGIQYNPVSIFQTLAWLTTDSNFSETCLEQLSNSWISWMHHHNEQFETKDQLLNKIYQTREEWNSFNAETPLFITLGTAWAYELSEKKILVANCHKQPNKLFTKKMLTLQEVIEAGNEFLSKTQRPIIFTVSPVRHLRDGFIENQRSKSVLHLAVQHWESVYEHVSYFPAYELVLDDLRDYRFFKDDLLHPNELAVDYIWEKLKLAMMNTNTIALVNRVEKVIKAVSHRPLHPDSVSWQKHVEGTLTKLNQLKQEGATVDWAIEQMQQYEQENQQ